MKVGFTISLMLILTFVESIFTLDCCPDLLLDVDQGSEIHSVQGGRLGFYKQEGMYGDRPQYRQVGGENFLFYLKDQGHWLVSSYHVGNSSGGVAKITSSYCPDNLHGWIYYNGNKNSSDGSHWHSTSDQDSQPLTSSCASLSSTCCKSVNISSADSYYHNSTGIFTAIGALTGRYTYQKKGIDRYLEFDNVGINWLVKDQLGTKTGYIYHEGSVCPEKASKRWFIHNNNNEWIEDAKLTVSCIEDEENLIENEKDETNADSNIKEKEEKRGFENNALSGVGVTIMKIIDIVNTLFKVSYNKISTSE